MNSEVVEALQIHHTYASLVVGLENFRNSSIAFRRKFGRNDEVRMGGSNRPKVVRGRWKIVDTIQPPMARILVLAMHHFDSIGHPGGSLGAATAG